MATAMKNLHNWHPAERVSELIREVVREEEALGTDIVPIFTGILFALKRVMADAPPNAPRCFSELSIGVNACIESIEKT